MTIAVNIMVKNGGDAVLRALHSIAAEVDELVVFDTGSTDGTQAAVQACFATLPDHLLKTFREVPWVDDFSAIRNQMLDATQSDWVFALDADEVVTVAERTLRELTHTGHVVFFIEKRSYVKGRLAAGITAVQNEYPALEKGFSGYASEPNYLFFKRTPQVRYSRRIHETIEASLSRHRIPSVRINHVVIHNYGRHDMTEKSQRYRALVERAVQDDPADGLAWFYLGAHDRTDGRLAEAIANLDRSLALLPEYLPAALQKALVLAQSGDIVAAEQLLLSWVLRSPQQEAVWLSLFGLAGFAADSAKLQDYIARCDAADNMTPALYDEAARLLAQMNKRVKADLYRRRAKELRRRAAR